MKPWWEKRVESEIRELRIDIDVFDREKMVLQKLRARSGQPD